jgi:hypothetical protein
MEPDELKRIMSEEEIVPSSGFVSSVMMAVRREAEEPQAIPFPWKRALPLFVAGGIALIALIVYAGGIVSDGVSGGHSTLPMLSVTLFTGSGTWTGMAYLISAGSVLYALRMAFSQP